MASKIIERILRTAGVPNLVDLLALRLSGSDLQSLLLEVYRRRAARRSARNLVEDYERNRFARPSSLDPRRLSSLDHAAFAALPAGFEPITLSPVAPLGTSSIVAAVDQNLALATIRNTEVLSDSTNALALECASRRRAVLGEDARSARQVKLAASHRLVRTQQYDDPRLLPHFQMFALVSAGRDEGAHRFEASSLPEHIGFYVELLLRGVGVPESRIRVSITPLSEAFHQIVGAIWLPDLAARFPGVRVELDSARTQGRGYYENACFKLHAQPPGGEEIELADGGFTDWTRQLLSNAKERFLISGIGMESVGAFF